MAKSITVNGVESAISMVVFDKDGLMFESQPFWRQIGNERIRALKEYLSDEGIEEWASLFGLKLEDGEVIYTDPKGILAVAAPMEEITVTASIILKYAQIPWAKAFDAASKIFKKADEELDLRKALKPTKGFPRIFHRLKEAGIPYAVATSDTRSRVISSLAMLDEKPPELIVVPEMVMRGKPAPDMLQLISEKTGIPTAEIAMVGDSYVDLLMAKNAGAVGIGVPETDEMHRTMTKYSEFIIDSLDDIKIVS